MLVQQQQMLERQNLQGSPRPRVRTSSLRSAGSVGRTNSASRLPLHPLDEARPREYVVLNPSSDPAGHADSAPHEAEDAVIEIDDVDSDAPDHEMPTTTQLTPVLQSGQERSPVIEHSPGAQLHRDERSRNTQSKQQQHQEAGELNSSSTYHEIDPQQAQVSSAFTNSGPQPPTHPAPPPPTKQRSHEPMYDLFPSLGVRSDYFSFVMTAEPLQPLL